MIIWIYKFTLRFIISNRKGKEMRVASITNPLFLRKGVPLSYKQNFVSFEGKFEDKARIIPSTRETNLSQGIMKNTGIAPTPTDIKKFKNGEIYVNIKGDVRGKDVYLMPSTGENVNDNLMETYLKADAAKRSGADKVIAILPSFDYARQERRNEAGEPIAAKMNMDLLKTAGVDEVITEDLHALLLKISESHTLNQCL